MARKVKTNLIALGSAAILAVYAAGYALTEHPTPATGQVQATTSAAVPAPDAATAVAQTLAGAPSAAPPAAAPSAAAQTYRDGSYTATGTSRRGDITVDVTVQGGKVTAAKITGSTTYYPTSEISRLPGEVVSRQSANVDFVSGATESSLAFRSAVATALRQASGAGATQAPVAEGQI